MDTSAPLTLIGCLTEAAVTSQTSRGHTHLIGCAAAGEEIAVVIAMNRQVENIRVIVEGLLGAVAVVNVLKGGQVRVTRR